LRVWTALWVALCLLSLSWASAQGLLESYRRATTTLARSADVFATDQVESLDALRRAKAAAGPLLAGLEPPLRAGLTTTFARAEAAIVNRSETDLRVQTAVLRGGVQRALYEAALARAADGDLPRARALLGVLAADLGLRQQPFSGSSPEALQTAFERRLAALSLAQLGDLGDDRGSRYETLARLYSHVFLVQDSPRLPAETQVVLLNAIRALVAREPLAPSLRTLRAQLTQFERAARAASPGNARSVAGGTPSEASTDRGANTGTNPDAGADTDVAVNPARSGRAVPPLERAVPDTQPATLPEVAPLQAAAPVPPAPAPPNPAHQLVGDLRGPLLIASGLLALAALARLVRASRGSRTPWRDAALALLLVPAFAEGVFALALALGPLVGLPLLGTLGAYSLFTNPFTQLLWPLVVASAVLCLQQGWRAAARADVSDVGIPKPGHPPPETPRKLAPSPFAASGLDWDEDF